MNQERQRRTPARALAIALQRPLPSDALVAFRIILGGLLTIGALRFLLNGWVQRFFVEPKVFFHYWGFGWVRAWSATGMQLHFVLLALLGLCVAGGVFYRVTAPLAFVAFTYVELIDVSGYLNHYYLLSLLLLLAAFMPLHRAGSFDAWRAGSLRGARYLPAWCTHLLRFQLATVYFYAGLAKVNADWLLHGQPLSIWLSSRADMPIVGPLLAHHETAMVMSWAGCIYDLTIWIWLSWARTRAVAYALVLGFHTAVGLLFNIGMFPFIMSLSALIFFPPTWPRAIWRGRRGEEAPSSPSLPQGTMKRRIALGLGAFYVAAQVLFPLRHFLYPGDVLWNEQGMRWSWKVLLREKNGAITYRVRRGDGSLVQVSPRQFLTDVQEREMSGQPDLILQLAHRIADQQRGLTGAPVSVYVDAFASLNGRPAQRLVDPTVDLCTVSDGLAPASWILPAPTTAPPHLRPVRAR